MKNNLLLKSQKIKGSSNENPYDLYHFSVVHSTNQVLKDCLPEKDTAIYADYQTAGRGQGNHTWHCQEKSGLLMSFLYYPQNSISAENLLILSAVTMATCIDQYLPQHLKTQIKYPNDILINHQKLAGILLENTFCGNQLIYSIIGIGVNLYQEQFSKHFSYARPPISLRQLGVSVNTQNLLLDFLERFYTNIKLDFSLINDVYEKKLWQEK